MARKKIDELHLMKEGFFGTVIAEYPYYVYIEKADSVDSDLSFEHAKEVYFTYYHFVGYDYDTHIFDTYEEAVMEAELLSDSIRTRIMIGEIKNDEEQGFFEHYLTNHKGVYGTIVNAFSGAEGEYYIEFTADEKYIVRADTNPKAWDVPAHSKKFDDYIDAEEYANFCGFDYCRCCRYIDKTLRYYGIVLKTCGEDIYLTYTRDLFVVYELDDKNRICRKVCDYDFYNAKKTADTWVLEKQIAAVDD